MLTSSTCHLHTHLLLFTTTPSTQATQKCSSPCLCATHLPTSHVTHLTPGTFPSDQDDLSWRKERRKRLGRRLSIMKANRLWWRRRIMICCDALTSLFVAYSYQHLTSAYMRSHIQASLMGILATAGGDNEEIAAQNMATGRNSAAKQRKHKQHL